VSCHGMKRDKRVQGDVFQSVFPNGFPLFWVGGSERP